MGQPLPSLRIRVTLPILVFCFLLCGFVATRHASAQQTYVHVVPDLIDRFVGDDDTTYRVLIGVGTYGPDSVFHPDLKQHSYSIAPPTPNIFTVQSPLSGKFTGVDTLLVTISRFQVGEWNVGLELWVDGTARTAQLNLKSVIYSWLFLTSVGDNARLEIGSQGCFDYYELRNSNPRPVTVQAIRFQTNDSLRVSPSDFPRVLQPNEKITFQICGKAPRAVDTLRGRLEVDLAAGSSLHDTISRDVALYVVPLYSDHCVQASYAYLSPIYPWTVSKDTTIYLTNRLSTPVTVTGLQALTPASSYYTLTMQSLPFTITGGATDSIHAHLQVPSGGLPSDLDGRWLVELTGTDSNGFDCPATYMTAFAGEVREFDEVTRSVTTPASESVTLLSWDSHPVYKMITLVNTGTPTATLGDASIAGMDGSDFNIEHTGFTPGTTLAPGDTTFVYVSFPTRQLAIGNYNGVLNLGVDNGIVSIPLSGQVVPLGVRQEAAAQADAGVLIRPNPSAGKFEIDLENVAACAITVSDALGRIVASSQNVKGTSVASRTFTNNLESGYYIVRVAGTATDRSPFVISRSIEVER